MIKLTSSLGMNGKLYFTAQYEFDNLFSREKRVEIDAAAHPRQVINAIRALLRAVENDYITHELCLKG